MLHSRMASSRADATQLLSRNESGTPPGDRAFRPDVQGLRAVAVVAVVLSHAGVHHLVGGYVGVDVFFVVSGFVITGLLLRERATTGGTRILAFYARRCRRILPAATLVVIVTVLFSYRWLGFIRGHQVANDGLASSLFVANFHFIDLGTNYINSKLPPSPLQNYWSLSVEEQFYVLYPTLFLVVSALARLWSLRTRLAVVLLAVLAASLGWSVIQTMSNGTAAYFSPLTRAWELALGGLIAVGSPLLIRAPKAVAAAAGWLGLGGIALACVIYNAATAYPGSAVILPVAATGLVIAGGAAAPGLGAELILACRPLQWLGKLSYSLYLWHWPLLIVMAQKDGQTFSAARNLAWVLVALGLSVVTYLLVENPVRHSRVLAGVQWRSLVVGAALIGTSLGVTGFEIATHP